MPAQLVHLSVAMEWGQNTEIEVHPGFLLGSVAPDAIHMRPGSSPEDKRVTHLHLNAPGYLSRLQTYIEAQINVSHADPQFWYGYGAHLITDFLWLNHVFIPYKDKVDQQVTKETRNQIYYKECEQNEVRLFQTSAWRPHVWEVLQDVPAPNTVLLSAEEIMDWKQHVLHTFDDTSVYQTSFDPVYITAQIVDHFISEAATYLRYQFHRFGWLTDEGAFGDSTNHFDAPPPV